MSNGDNMMVFQDIANILFDAVRVPLTLLGCLNVSSVAPAASSRRNCRSLRSILNRLNHIGRVECCIVPSVNHDLVIPRLSSLFFCRLFKWHMFRSRRLVLLALLYRQSN